MDGLFSAAGALTGLAASGAVGFLLGKWARARKVWVYWVLNVAGILVGAAVCALAAMYSQTWLWTTGLAVMAGSVTGLKYGLARTVALPVRAGVGSGAGKADRA